ncbi:MAG: phosphotransferase [Chloroflexi bacterium]|nr:phosphotransferase [Chloroflexota bacterium]
MTETAIQPIPPAVIQFCNAAGFGTIDSVEILKGGAVNLTRRLTTHAQTTLILKESADPAPDLYPCEAMSLRTLRAAGLHTPEVLAVGADFLLLDDVGGEALDDSGWERLGRAIASLHLHTNERFGFEQDNYLGLLRQYNPWTDDGHEFFAKYRILRYLSVPVCEQTLTAEDRYRLERLAQRLPELIPVQPASLLHGDLWHANTLLSRTGEPVVLDPAVYYGWAEAELSMVRQCGGVPQVFFDAYNEVNPLTEGWWERLEILYVREILSVIAHFGDYGNVTLAKLRAVLDKFA